MPLFDDSSFDFGDFVSGGDPIDFNWSDVNFGGGSYGGFDFDLGSLPNFGFDLTGISDLADAFNFGDLSGIAGLGNVDLSGLANYDQGDFYDFGYGELPLDPREIDGLQGSRTEETVFNELPFSTDNSGDVENQPGGFYGNTPNATYDPKTNLTTIRDNNGNIVRTIQGPPTTTDTTRTPITRLQDLINRTTGGKDNTALLAAILGGLVGLLTKGGKPKPVGYQGGIPKYTATRGAPGQGVTYTRAAGGGLMDLAEGGRAARYLRGGTDGMADKIKTDIDGKQPARLSHGEFVIPADVVSHLGNGNSDAGADVLYDMMAKVRKARTGTPRQGKQINPRKYTPV